ncbi:hypothetical protein IFM89_018065 [Coptis chinensis]|uniref:Uncharacterized protein n=1 Tax=Coptis chinensis TaxID=261450 RepID=A0A835ICQ2_9MAGN|nr:hypothetical protein IFM89_018065 [Coptis chinensis]
MEPNYEDPLNHDAATVLRDNPNVRRAMSGGRALSWSPFICKIQWAIKQAHDKPNGGAITEKRPLESAKASCLDPNKVDSQTLDHTHKSSLEKNPNYGGCK